ncbi:MAG: YkgJ family cysteine cluster protein [Aureispira sp.]
MAFPNNALEVWRNKKDNSLKAHKKFGRKLQKHKGKHLDRLAQQTHEQVFEHVDCLECAGCCKGLPPIVNNTDAQRIAKHLGLSVATFERDFLTIDEDKDTVLQQTPCPFLLENNYCSIYEFRPKACRSYPHTDEQFSKNIPYHIKNMQHCPATFFIVEQLKRAVPV